MKTKRPSFRKAKAALAYNSPEELFGKLPNREKSHGYLRGPQADALRGYMNFLDEPDIAMELPTGTGKTTVGLLIAEWCRRRSGKKVAYLSLTNQLANQVLTEAERLGIDCADLRGTKETRKAMEVGRYQAGQAVGITTYSNLFNVNPVVQVSDLLVLDDAHGGEHFVTDMWTVCIDSRNQTELYDDALSILRPSLNDSQYRVVTDDSQYGTVELADTHGHSEVINYLIELIDNIDIPSILFPWNLIRNNLDSCIVLLTQNVVVIRPLVPPTYEHDPFSESRQRIYMSATLGGEGDLMRSYGVLSIKTIRAQHPQWGKRYIFTPGLYLEDGQTEQLIAGVWKNIEARRALLLAPSFSIAKRVFSSLASMLEPEPSALYASHIENSLTAFTGNDNTILCLAGRYDGLDLPGDDCRLLIMAESPGAVTILERYHREHWKLGPLLRRRERTRLLQGMGRCTRDATDFAVIIMIGQSLINSVTTPVVIQGLPGEIQRELNWGITQGDVANEDIEAFTQMILGILNDSSYRKEANESIEETEFPETITDTMTYDQSAKHEVNFSKALWEGNYSKAYKIARSATDEVNGPELCGYCAWWFYLGAIAAHLLKDLDSELDCLKRARAIGVNAGFIDHILRKRTESENTEKAGDISDIQVESVWNRIEHFGWHGHRFGTSVKKMKDGLSSLTEPTQYHIGLELLGQWLGAETIRSTEDGAPDLVWIFSDQCFTFEAKSNKKPEGRLYKKNVQQAKGHPDWLIAKRPDLAEVPIQAVVVSTTNSVDDIALPYTGGLSFISTDAMIELANSVVSELKTIRAEFAGKEYGVVLNEFKARIKRAGLLSDSINMMLSKPLYEKQKRDLMSPADIVQKLWNYCNVLRDDGMSYGDYVEQLTYLLFLKMADERSNLPAFDAGKKPEAKKKSIVPKEYDWKSLLKRDGDELFEHYRNALRALGKGKGMLGLIFMKSQNKFQDPAKLRRLIVDLIDSENWSVMSADVKGDAYEGLLEKNAQDTKSGAGQYFTPRPLIRAMVDVINPQPGETICDPACGTGGFFLAAHDYIVDQNKNMSKADKKNLKNKSFKGWELVQSTARLCAMNFMLHGIGSDEDLPILVSDSLAADPGDRFNIVLTNPPFGKKSSTTIVNGKGQISKQKDTIEREDFWSTTSNKQLNFVQHVKTLLKQNGRAAIVVPDNVLFEGGAGENIRRKLLHECDVHTLLRLPTGLFYAQGVKANVLFFDRKAASETPWSKKLWIYDLRTNMHFTLKTNSLKREDLDEFVKCYNPQNRNKRKPTWTEKKPDGRWRAFEYDELMNRDKASLDIFWLKDESLEDSENLPDPGILAQEIVVDLEAALEQFRAIAEDLGEEEAS